jgi:hypothetical protein
MTIPTFPTHMTHENTWPKIQKSTLPLSEGGTLTTLQNHLEIDLSPTLGVTLSPAMDPLPQLHSNPPDFFLPLSPKKILLSNLPH